MVLSQNIRSREKYGQEAWDWNIFNQCFTHGIRVSDVDGITERNDHFLFLEGKPDGFVWEKGDYDGQRRAHLALAKWPRHTFITLWGESNKDGAHVSEWEILHCFKRMPATLEDVQGWIRDVWYAHANTCFDKDCTWRF